MTERPPVGRIRSGGRRPWRRLPLVLLGLLMLSPAAPGATPVPSAEAQERRLEALRQRIEAVRRRIRDAEGQRSALNRRLEETERDIGRLARRLRVLRGRIERKTRRLESLRRQAARQREALARERALLARQVRAAYAMGRQEQLRILLSQQDPAAVTRVLTYYDYLNRERVRRMERLRVRLAELAETRAAIEAERGRLARLHETRAAEMARLEARQAERREVIERLAREIRGGGEELARLHRDERRLQRLLRDLREALSDIPAAPAGQQPFPALRGRLPWPVSGRIRRAFGDPRIGKLRWDGVMIEAPEGREVRAVHAGRVAFADWLRGFGLLLIIDHGDGYMTLYGHNQSLFKEAGDWVEAGEPVAAAGSTGGLRESGVYFAIRRNGRPVDPVRWCRRPRGRRVG